MPRKIWMRVLLALCLLCASSSTRCWADDAKIAITQAETLPANGLWLESLDLKSMTSGYDRPRAGKNRDGGAIKLGGKTYERGVGTHADSLFTVDLKGSALKFLAMVGIDDSREGKGVAVFTVSVDGRKVFDSGVMKGGEAPKLVSVPLDGAQRMVLSAISPGDNSDAHADWAGAVFLLKSSDAPKPEAYDISNLPRPDKLPVIIPDGEKPAIHGARLLGASPQRPFLFLVPATGKAPLTYAANGLPEGLKIDAKTGIITGRIAQAGTYNVELVVKNALGETRRVLEVRAAPGKIALTPPLGWNAWNVFGEEVTADKVREQADWLIKSGLAARGYNYIIVDDTWQARRDKDGTIAPNRRFGDMKTLADYLHARGLKLGLFSSPSEESCSGFAGSGGYEEQDAATYASWGVDYLKYDWCGVGKPADQKPEILKAAYAKMRAALDKVDRDIFFAVTTYGIGEPWSWATDDSVRANSWTTSPQILDRWDYVRDSAFKNIAADKTPIPDNSRPGHWNDAGWLMLGKVGAMKPHFTKLSASEQRLQVSMWSLLASPMILSSDLRQLNPNHLFPITTGLLFNDEVLDVNQDMLGQAAKRVLAENNIEIWARPLADGTRAVGFFNKSNVPQEVRINWNELGISGNQRVRDLWQRKDIGTSNVGYMTVVFPHSGVLLKIGQAK